MDRRTFLATAGVAAGAATAGCGGLLDGGDGGPDRAATLEDPPDSVYVPTHREGMEMADMASAGRYRFALTYSFPHPFWQVRAGDTNEVEVVGDDAAHVMLSVWDDETGTVLPVSDIPATIRQDGEAVRSPTMWLMLSQNMGVHFGDNVPLPGDGTYEVEIDYGPIDEQLLGDLQPLGEAASATFDLEFSQDTLQELPYEQFDDRAGERDALPPMEMDMMPAGQLPEPADLPGELLGTARSDDDVAFAATTLSSPPEGADGEGAYLAVSPRTPYNRYPLPRLSLATAVDGGDPQVLTPSIHQDLGYHYGLVVESAPEAGELVVAVDSPSTAARHEGYETALLGSGEVTIEP